MNRDRFEGGMQVLLGRLRERWGSLTSDEQCMAAGVRDQLAGRVQEQQGIHREESDRQLNDFLRRNRNWDLSNRQ